MCLLTVVIEVEFVRMRPERYRIELLVPASHLESARSSAERVVFVRQPGSRQPLLCWEREPSGTAPAWRSDA